jgi:hypothetical protein
MKGSDVFPGKYLRAADLNGHEPIVTIDRVEMEKFDDGPKPIVYFVGKERGVVLNKTNWAAIADINGSDDSDDWKGTKIKLITAKVEYQGKRVPAIRNEEAKGARQAPPPPPPAHELAEDEIPF